MRADRSESKNKGCGHDELTAAFSYYKEPAQLHKNSCVQRQFRQKNIVPAATGTEKQEIRKNYSITVSSSSTGLRFGACGFALV